MSRRSSQPTDRSDSPWYADGLRFECTQCGACCSGEPGYVFVDASETAAMARELQLSVAEFEERYTRRVGNRISLIEHPGGDCIFLDPKSRHCLVYASRPIQCRTWPFWDSTLASPADWRETCEACPGAGKGALYTLDQIEVRRREKSV